MAYIRYFSGVEDIVIDADRNPKEGGQSVFFALSKPPALLSRVFFPYLIAFFGPRNGLLEHFLDDVIHSHSNRGCPFNEGEGGFVGGDFS